MAEIKIYGQLTNKTMDGVLADSSQILYEKEAYEENNETKIKNIFVKEKIQKLEEDITNITIQDKKVVDYAYIDFDAGKCLETGIYRVSGSHSHSRNHSKNNPEGSSEYGVLVVDNYSNEIKTLIRQMWFCEKGFYLRFITKIEEQENGASIEASDWIHINDDSEIKAYIDSLLNDETNEKLKEFVELVITSERVSTEIQNKLEELSLNYEELARVEISKDLENINFSSIASDLMEPNISEILKEEAKIQVENKIDTLKINIDNEEENLFLEDAAKILLQDEIDSLAVILEEVALGDPTNIEDNGLLGSTITAIATEKVSEKVNTTDFRNTLVDIASDKIDSAVESLNLDIITYGDPEVENDTGRLGFAINNLKLSEVAYGIDNSSGWLGSAIKDLKLSEISDSKIDTALENENISEKVLEKIDSAITDLNLNDTVYNETTGLIPTAINNLKINETVEGEIKSLVSLANTKINESLNQYINQEAIKETIEGSESLKTHINTYLTDAVNNKSSELSATFVTSSEYEEYKETINGHISDFNEHTELFNEHINAFGEHLNDFKDQIDSLAASIAASSNETLYLTGEEMAAAINGETINADGEKESKPFEFFIEKYPNDFYIIFCTETNENSIPKYTGNALYYYNKKYTNSTSIVDLDKSFRIMGSGNITSKGTISASFATITANNWPSNAAISNEKYELDAGSIYSTLSGNLNAFNGTVDAFDNETGELLSSGSGAALSVNGSGISAENTDVNIVKETDQLVKVSNKGKITINASKPVTNTLTLSVSVKDDTDRIDYSISNNSRTKTVTFYQPALIAYTYENENGDTVEEIVKTFNSDTISGSVTINLPRNSTVTYYTKSQELTKYYLTAAGYGYFDFDESGTTTRTINGVENVNYKYYSIQLKAAGETVIGI